MKALSRGAGRRQGREGEAGGVGLASSGDFQHAFFHRQGGVVRSLYFLRIPAEGNVVFQQEGAAIEGGIREEVAVPAGDEMRLFPLVGFAAEDDRSFRVADIPLPVRVAVEREVMGRPGSSFRLVIGR